MSLSLKNKNRINAKFFCANINDKIVLSKITTDVITCSIFKFLKNSNADDQHKEFDSAQRIYNLNEEL